MKAEFWHNKWEINQIGFHMNRPNPLLINHIQTLQLPKNSTLFLPLCGKTLDIAYLLAQGFKIIGNELSEIAIKALFDELELTPEITTTGNFKRYQADRISIYVGDFFDLSHQELGTIDATYDRAALIALPIETRKRYAKHLTKITNNAPQLLISLDYDQGIMNGPPFSVDSDELNQHYSTLYHMDCVESNFTEDGLKGKYPVTESAWILTSNA